MEQIWKEREKVSGKEWESKELFNERKKGTKYGKER